jgi:hypothetical protein
MAARHPDIIKIWVDDFFGSTEPKMPPEIYGAISDEADKHGLRVAAHIFPTSRTRNPFCEPESM